MLWERLMVRLILGEQKTPLQNQNRGENHRLMNGIDSMNSGGALKKRRRKRRLPANGEEANAGPRRERGSAVKLGTTGRQTRIARKAGGRVTKKGAFVGEGRALGAKSDEEEVDEDMSTKGYVLLFTPSSR